MAPTSPGPSSSLPPPDGADQAQPQPARQPRAPRIDSTRPPTSRVVRAQIQRILPHGGLEMRVPVAQVVVSRMWGHLDVTLCECLLGFMQQRLLTTDRCFQLFHDWSAMETYDTPARLLLTNWLQTHRDRFEAIHILSGSRLVAMGVAVANLALDRFLTPYNIEQRSRYEAALEQVLAQKTPPRG